MTIVVERSTPLDPSAGIALYRLAGRLDRPEFGDLDRRAARIDQRERPTELMSPFQEP